MRSPHLGYGAGAWHVRVIYVVLSDVVWCGGVVLGGVLWWCDGVMVLYCSKSMENP